MKIVERLRELAHAVTLGEDGWHEFTMRVPAEPKRDADLVLSSAADLIEALIAIPHYSDPKLSESRCIGCDCTKEHQMHDPYCPVARVEKLLGEGK